MFIAILSPVACAVVAGGIATAFWAAVRGSRTGCEALIVLSAVWLLVNKPVEIKILWTVAPGHGLVVADLLSPAILLFAAVRLRTLPREPKQPRHAGRAGVDDLLFGDQHHTLDLDAPGLDRPEIVPWLRADLDHDARIDAGRPVRRSRLKGRGETDQRRHGAA